MTSELTTAIMIGALVLGLAGIGIQIAFLLTLQRALEGCAPRNRTVSPGQVWLALIPLFNLVWQFILVSRIAETLRLEFESRELAHPAAQDDYGRGVGLAMCILGPLAIIPLAGILFGLAGFVCWILYWVKIGGYSKTLGLAAADNAGPGFAAGEEPPQFQEFRNPGGQWLVLLVLVFGWGASYLQRSALSMVLPSLRADLGVSSVQIGWVLSAFMLGLMAGYVLMTVVTALCGTRWGLVAAFAGASLSACSSGLLPSITGLIAARFLLGFFTGGLLPAAIQCTREWLPPRLRPLAIGAIFASGLAVSALAPLLVVFLSRAMGWRTVLMVTGLPTAIIALLCVLAWPSPPRSEVYRGVSTAAIASTAMLAVGLFCAAPISYFVTGWLPTYLRTIHHVGLATSGTASALVLAAGCCGGLLAGAIACAVATSSKKRAAMLTACGCLLPVVALSGIVQDWRISMALAALSFAAYQGWYTLLYSAVADTLPARGVAVAAAIGALSLGLSGIATPAVFGQLINGAGGFQPVFPMLAATALGGLLSAGLLAWLVRMEPVG